MFNRYGQSKGPSPCVFISHSSIDKPFARQVANALTSMRLDIYFDEHDQCIKNLSGQTQDERVVRCIEAGLDGSSHLLGLISKNTKESWWVPYEIGGAAGRRHGCAHLVSAEVQRLPAYIKAARLLLDQDDLDVGGADSRCLKRGTRRKRAEVCGDRPTPAFPHSVKHAVLRKLI
jgi:hypothetical protein